MIMTPDLERVVRRLESRAALQESDREALRALPFFCRTLDASSFIVREGEKPAHCTLLIEGFAIRHKVTGGGNRQILSVHMAGEFLDLHNSFLDVADHNVQALTRVEVAAVPVLALQALAAAQPRLARAMWVDTLIDAAIFREWIVNVGRRDSLTRIAHLLCEFAVRMRDAGLADGQFYELPMTQEQIGDAVGLTPVHVNRVLKELAQRGLIERDRRSVAIIDWDRLRKVGDFSSRYLHFEHGTPNMVQLIPKGRESPRKLAAA